MDTGIFHDWQARGIARNHYERNLMKTSRTQKGRPFRRPPYCFTLVELLVVIAIISLLVSIILPSLNRAKGLAKTMLCSTNLKNTGTSLFMYADNFNDLYPLANNEGIWETPNSMGLFSWMEQLYPYHEAKKIYLCPERPGNSDYSYFLGVRAAYVATEGYFASVNRGRIRFPSDFVLSGCTSYPFDLDPDDCDKDDYTQNCVGYPSHNNGEQTILFADNHVKAYNGYKEGEMTFRYDEMSAW
jgi:prepilin-type N-terminal cleavage/methylation domain-containing protein